MSVFLKRLFYVAASFVFSLSLTFSLGCQLKPTQVSTESSQLLINNAVLIDTRSPLKFESSHIEGSQNLWWEDYLVIKTLKPKTYVFQPDLVAVIERLAKKGIHPQKTIYLLGEEALSIENKKWKWLLSYLDVRQVELQSYEQFRKSLIGKPNRFSKPEAQKSWTLLSSEDYQKELLRKKIPQCFISWSEKKCF